IVKRWRGRPCPVERRGLPGIGPETPSVTELRDDVDEHERKADGHNETADRGNEIVDFPAGVRRIGMDTARHAEKPCEMHHEKSGIEADEYQPERRLRQVMHRKAARDVRQPIIKPCKQGKDEAADQHIVEMRHDEMSVMRLLVERHHCEHDAGKTTYDKH